MRRVASAPLPGSRSNSKEASPDRGQRIRCPWLDPDDRHTRVGRLPPDEEIWSEPVLAVLDTDPPQLWPHNPEKPSLKPALRVAGKTGGSAKTATNTPVRWALGGGATDETSLIRGDLASL